MRCYLSLVVLMWFSYLKLTSALSQFSLHNQNSAALPQLIRFPQLGSRKLVVVRPGGDK
jgi:hypothetical protein